MTMASTSVFSMDERKRLLEESFTEVAKLRVLGAEYEKAEGQREKMIEIELDRSHARVKQLWREYEARLPVLEMSRCPFTGLPWTHSIDNLGLDGYWWSADKPLRPIREPLGGKYLCFTGAVKLAKEIEKAPFLVKPGPEVPFVIPRLLKNQPSKAVISSVAIGKHEGCAIVYFSPRLLPGVKPCADWGTNTHQQLNAVGGVIYEEVYDTEEDYDFELQPWIASGQVLWIAPGDTRMRLESSVAGCPYLEIEGRRKIVRIRDGQIVE